MNEPTWTYITGGATSVISGHFSADDDTLAATAHIYLSNTDASGTALAAFLAKLFIGEILQLTDAAGRVSEWSITAATVAAGYLSLAVTLVSSQTLSWSGSYSGEVSGQNFRSENVANKVTAFSTPTDTQYPSAKLVSDSLAAKAATTIPLTTVLANSTITPVADGTYTVGIGNTTNGTITTAKGVITAVQQAS